MHKAASLFLIALLLAFLGCGSNSPRVIIDPPIAAIALHASATTVEAGASVTFVANVANTSNQAVTWHVNGIAGGHLSCGFISEGVYTAPATITSAMQVTITAALQSNPAIKDSATLTVTPPVTLKIEPENAVLQAGATQKFTLKLSDGTAATGVWIAYGAEISTDGVVNVPLGVGNIYLQATSNTTPAKSASATVRVLASNAMLSGTYTFAYDGVHNGEHFAMAGTFSADGKGGIAGGILDSVSPSSVERDVPFTGTYHVGPDGRGRMTLDTPSGQRNWSMAIAGPSEIVVAELGTGSSGTGIMQLPGASTAIASGVYLFGPLVGSKGPAIAGMLEPTATNVAGEYDLRRRGKPAVHTTFIDSGTVPASTRGILSWTDSLGLHEFRVYPVSPATFYAVSLDPALDVLLRVEQQIKAPLTTSQFAPSHTLIGGGSASTGTIALFGRDISLSDGKVQAGSLDEHRAKSFHTLAATGGSYSPGPGRAEFKIVTASGTRSFIGYVSNNSGNLILEEDETQVSATIELQPIELFFDFAGPTCYDLSMFSAASPGVEGDIVLGLLMPAAESDGWNTIDALQGGTVLLDQVVTSKIDLLTEGSTRRGLRLTGPVSRDYMVQGCRAISVDPLVPEIGRLWGFPWFRYPEGIFGLPWLGPIGGW